MADVTTIKAKLERLRVRPLTERDVYRPVYQPRTPLTELQIQQFEQRHRVQLPDGYRTFLLEIGNGGTGPYHGICPLDVAVAEDRLGYRPAVLSTPFPLRQGLNVLQRCAGVDNYEDYYRRCEEDPTLSANF